MKRIALIFAWIAVIFLTVAALSIAAHCSTVKQCSRKGGDQIITLENPYTYLFALPVEGTMLDGEKYTNIRFQPFSAPLLYDESILFCGDVRDMFYSTDQQPFKGPVVITYDRIGHKQFGGQACHELITVFPVVIQ